MLSSMEQFFVSYVSLFTTLVPHILEQRRMMIQRHPNRSLGQVGLALAEKGRWYICVRLSGSHVTRIRFAHDAKKSRNSYTF